MSLVPYQSHEGREIVLRHHNAIVVRDPASQRLEIRGLTECPTCHQPLDRASSDQRPFDRSYGASHESYVDPDYFRMLRAGHPEAVPNEAPPSPVRRLFRPPALAGRSGSARGQPSASPDVQDEAEFVSSTPGVAQAEGSKIRREAFQPNYFNTFFVEERVLGKGGKGVVLLVRHEIDGCHLGHFACKRVPVGDDHTWLEKVLIEVELLAKLSHPNLVSYRHVWLEDYRLTRFGPSVACAFILQQYCNGGDLHTYVVGGPPRQATKEELKAQMRRRSKGQLEVPKDLFPPGSRQLSFDEIYSLFKDITSGVAYLHAANYIHRDLKPSNCLLHREGGRLICLISDFGEVQAENVVRKSTGSTGTISYCAPEVLKMDADGRYGNFTTKSDVFSLGMILYFMCFRRLPYRSANAIQEELEDIDQLRIEITDWQGFQGERRERPDLPPKLYMLLKQLLALNPIERPSANEVLKAMRSESTPEGFSQGNRASSPAIGLNGSRVQNLDSPNPSGTPVPDPRKRQLRSSVADSEDLDSWPNSSNGDMSHSVTTRRTFPEEHQSSGLRNRTDQTMVVSRSPSLPPEPATLPDNHNDDLVTTTAESFVRPLLLAPPRTRTQGIYHSLWVILHQTFAILGLDLGLVNYFTRLGIFLIKVTSLTRPCWPYMINWHIGAPLVAVAALDLGLPQASSSSTELQPSREAYVSEPRRAWGFGTSLLLLVFHFAALKTASAWASICTPNLHEEWHSW